MERRLFIGARWKDPADSRNNARPTGSPGNYVVKVALAPPFYIRPSIPAGNSVQLGDSNILMPDKILGSSTSINIGDQVASLRFIPNPDGRLAIVELDPVNAVGFADAELVATKLISALLSQWSILLDVPLQFNFIEVKEISTNNHRIGSTIPAPIAHLPRVLSSPRDDEFRYYASLYREAHNATSNAYKFLCFHKIIDGLKSKRAEAAKAARERGEAPRTHDDLIPSTRDECATWLSSVFPWAGEWLNEDLEVIFPAACRGRKITEILTTHLQPIRNKIAHVFMDDGTPGFFPDDPWELIDIQRWIGLAMAITKRMLMEEFPLQFNPANESVPRAT